MTQHTPGPWAWIGDHTHKQFDIYELAQGIHAGHDSKHICTINNLPRHKLENRDAGRAEANARLISAAPDLLSALREMVAEWNRHGCCDSTDARYKADQAIAKAEGKEPRP